MDLVAERDRLLRRYRRPLGKRAQNPYETRLHRFFERIWSAMWSEARIDNDKMVIVGFWYPPVTKLLPSTTNRFLMSWDWFHLLSTLDFGSSPMRHVPSSWML